MKLERINAAAQVELPKARPLSRSHSVSKIRAPVPERKRTPQRTATRPLWDLTGDACLSRDIWDFCELLGIAQSSARSQHHGPGNSGQKGTNNNASFSCVNRSDIIECQHGNE